MTIGKAAIGLIIALAVSPLIVYLSVPSYSTSAASIPVVNNLVVVADEVYVTRAGVESPVDDKQITLEQGDSIRTSDSGRALINFFDGSSTQLEPDTSISVDELSMTKAGSTTVQFTQQVGITWSRVAKLVDTKSSFNIKTAAAVAVIRGTLIAIDVQEGDGETQITEVKVFEGLSDVVAGGQTVQVGSGNQTTVDEGEPPDEPIEIPPPPAELDINVASPVWLHVADPLQRNAGIVPPGFDTNEIPFSTNSGILGEPQNVHITEPLAGRYHVMMHSRGDGPVTLSVDAYNDGVPYDGMSYAPFNVISGGTYYITVDIDVDAVGHITTFDAGDVYQPPQADFTTDVTVDGKASTVVGDPVQFTGDYGDGHYTSTSWEFGDGNTSTLDDPAHTYSIPGIYTVTHVVDNPVARQTKIKTDYVTVYDAPQTDFTSNYTEVVAGDSVAFTDTSSGSPTTWAWDFGDGGTGTEQNPAHTYAAPGTYTVSLEASNLAGSDTETKTGYVKVYAPIEADFTTDPIAAIVDVPLQFTDASVGVARTWVWDFGDGGTSTDQNPTHAYTSTGTYSVSLDVTNPLDSDTVTQPITVYEPPVAAFSADQTSVTVGTTINFTNLSENSTAWNWDFGDGGTSTDYEPSYTFNVPGEYDVLLTASNPDADASDDELKTAHITVYGPPIPGFSADDTAVQINQVIEFSSDSTTAIPSLLPVSGWLWDFGDGETSDFQNPTHSYSVPGNYTVSLTATNDAGNGTTTKTDYILVHGPPEADFSADTLFVRVGESVQFTDLSTGEPSAWQWEFGDESGSTDQNPIHTFESEGTYTIFLMATNAAGTGTIEREEYITAYTVPVVDFGADILEVEAGYPVQFTDLSIGDPFAWQWDFESDRVIDSTDQNPSHIYTQPGIYTVTLTATNDEGDGVGVKTGYINVYGPVDVTITSPDDQDSVYDRIVDIQGTVTDPSRETVTVTVNGSSSTVQVMDGMFSQLRSILPGENTITVTASNPGYSDSDTITVHGTFPSADIVAELTWDTGEDPVNYEDADDLDSHLIWPQGEDYWDYYRDNVYDFDCYYSTSYVDEDTGDVEYTPDWDESTDVSAGDPVLSIDNTWGWGPETITLEEVAVDGRYWYFVHFYWDEEPVNGSTATVRIWINDVLTYEASLLMQDDHIWECAYIDWLGGTGTVTAGSTDTYDEDDIDIYHGGGEGDNGGDDRGTTLEF